MHFGFGGFGMILFWIAIAVGVVVLAKVLFSFPTRDESGSRDPLGLLKERYAAGEITRSDFEKMKRDILER